MTAWGAKQAGEETLLSGQPTGESIPRLFLRTSCRKNIGTRSRWYSGRHGGRRFIPHESRWRSCYRRSYCTGWWSYACWDGTVRAGKGVGKAIKLLTSVTLLNDRLYRLVGTWPSGQSVSPARYLGGWPQRMESWEK